MMNPRLLALFIRALREQARAGMTPLARGGLLLVMLAFMLTIPLSTGWVGAPGLKLFERIVLLDAVFITVAGMSYFASAITEEKEAQTLSLLQMADMSPLLILLGKSTSRLVAALLLLAVQFPFTLLAISLGGISLTQVVAAHLVLAGYLIFVCNLALLFSVVATRTTSAAILTGIALMVLPLGGGLLEKAALAINGPGARWLEWSGAGLQSLMPFSQLAEIMGTGFSGPVIDQHLWWPLSGAAVALLLAWLIFEPAASRAPAGGSRSGWTLPRSGWLAPGRPRAGHALQWKDYHFLHGGRAGFLLRFLAYGAMAVWAGGATRLFVSGYNSISFVGLAFALGLLLTLDLAVMASRIFRHEIGDKTLGALASLPSLMTEVVAAKTLACRMALLPAAIFITAAVAAWLVRLGMKDTLLEGLGSVALTLFFGGIIVGYMSSQVLLGVNLIAYLSLRMPRGALPLGFVICWVANLIMLPLSAVTLGIGFAMYWGFSAWAASRLRQKIATRLEALAAEEGDATA